MEPEGAPASGRVCLSAPVSLRFAAPGEKSFAKEGEFLERALKASKPCQMVKKEIEN
jgi:hypothetical protein